jgi:hypothetical protein
MCGATSGQKAVAGQQARYIPNYHQPGAAGIRRGLEGFQ